MSKNIDKRNKLDYHNIMCNSTSCNPFAYENKNDRQQVNLPLLLLAYSNQFIVLQKKHCTQLTPTKYDPSFDLKRKLNLFKCKRG